MKLEIKAPAKINFGLNIVSKRDDGFHNLETIFYPLQLHDKLVFTKSYKYSFTSNNAVLNAEDDNLILKAVELLEQEYGRQFPVEVEVDKKIPLGAGMGGGSSDCAAALHAVNILYELNIPNERLMDYALRLGSDVPFFINPKPSFARGRGEILEVIDFEINLPILIVNPGIHINTAWAFKNITAKPPAYNLKEIAAGKPLNFAEIKDKVTNDFEAPVFEKYPEISELKSALAFAGALFTLMTGSGSTLFGVFPDLKSANHAKQLFQQHHFTYLHYEEND